MSKKRKTRKFNNDIKINVATIVIATILIYVCIRIFMMVTKKPITTYKVNKSNVNNNMELTGLAIRDEVILKSIKSGYICYYVRDGEKIKKNTTICTVDETGKVYDQISNADSYEDLLTKDDYDEIRSMISLYKVGYDDTRFYSSYNFESNLNSKVLELTNEMLMQQIETSEGAFTYSSIASPYSGVVTYYTDGYEEYKVNDVTRASFDRTDYAKETLKTGERVESSASVAKIIADENWNIVCPITDAQAEALETKHRVAFSINNSSYKVTAPFEIISKDDGKYINIKLESFVYNFMSERFLSIVIFMEENSGLKVPETAITYKNVYKIPVEFFSAGGNQTQTNRLNIQSKDSAGNQTIKQVSPTIYKTEDDYCYVDPLVFTEGDILLNITNNHTLSVSMLEKDQISGVYSANRGIAEFRMVVIIKSIDDFVLIDADAGIKVYDNIILDATKVKENQIIY